MRSTTLLLCLAACGAPEPEPLRPLSLLDVPIDPILSFDAGQSDAAVEAPDAGEVDAGTPDAGMVPPPVDAGQIDAGSTPFDAGPPDAGPPDAGPVDAGRPDAGPPDAGPGPCGAKGEPSCKTSAWPPVHYCNDGLFPANGNGLCTDCGANNGVCCGDLSCNDQTHTCLRAPSVSSQSFCKQCYSIDGYCDDCGGAGQRCCYQKIPDPGTFIMACKNRLTPTGPFGMSCRCQ